MNIKPIRLTATSYALLALLDQLGESTPYEIKQAMEQSIENFWPVPHTTAYEEPARLATGGYLSVRQEEGGRRRKAYSLTDEGRAALTAWAGEATAAPPQIRDELLLKLFAGANPGPLLKARMAWHEEKIAELQGYLDEVRGKDEWRPSELTLTAGIGYHRKMLELMESAEPQP
ncbi:MAG TPA: PadR family transcriptional regulator [Solirubrobacterales bacterium]|jgi:DNA-binding PadR family transcriptional regulator|nr:PadR family transcriptional regulator [Solirubrobacterales bacterium]